MAEVVRKLETEPPTVEVSQPSIYWCVDFGNGRVLGVGGEGECWCLGTNEIVRRGTNTECQFVHIPYKVEAEFGATGMEGKTQD